MQIKTDSFSGSTTTPWATDTSTPTHQNTDTHFFASQLNSTEPPRGAATSITGTPLLADRSAQLDRLSNRVTKGLRDMSLNKNTKETREITKSLSEAHQQLAVSVKIVNKTVQLIEKTTNLQ